MRANIKKPIALILSVATLLFSVSSLFAFALEADSYTVTLDSCYDSGAQ